MNEPNRGPWWVQLRMPRRGLWARRGRSVHNLCFPVFKASQRLAAHGCLLGRVTGGEALYASKMTSSGSATWPKRWTSEVGTTR